MQMPSRLHLRPRRDDRPRSRGQAVVEFALILPVFLLLTLGVVDMARVFTSYIALTNGVSNASIYASQGNHLKWCTGTATAADVPCPAGTVATQQAQNPGNIAYQIRVEAVGLDIGTIVMSAPLCTLTSDGTTANCTSTTPNAYSSVRITASYQMTLLTPLMTTLMGGPVQMTAATTAAVQ
jgi:Flp pilus assembly protein TadG